MRYFSLNSCFCRQLAFVSKKYDKEITRQLEDINFIFSHALPLKNKIHIFVLPSIAINSYICNMQLVEGFDHIYNKIVKIVYSCTCKLCQLYQLYHCIVIYICCGYHTIIVHVCILRTSRSCVYCPLHIFWILNNTFFQLSAYVNQSFLSI